jgi:hypothetical protein
MVLTSPHHRSADCMVRLAAGTAGKGTTAAGPKSISFGPGPIGNRRDRCHDPKVFAMS